MQILNKYRTKFDKIFNIDIIYDDDSESNIKKMILKQVPLKDKTSLLKINNIFSEAMITHTFNSNYLNKSIESNLDNDNLYMIMNTAECSFSNLKKAKQKLMEYWLIEISKSIIDLHKIKIIHGDIKPDNILINKKEIKLADFEMSAFILNGNVQKFNNKMYTCTYRAPEVFFQDEWGFSADIWALGCTYIKILYGKNVLPKFESIDDYRLFFNNWNPRKYIEEIDTNEWYKKYNELLISMLDINPLKRPNIFIIYNELYRLLDNNNESPSSIISTEFNSLFKRDLINYSKNQDIFLKNEIIKLTNIKNNTYIDLIISLYLKNIDNVNKYNALTLRSCAIIINFIVFNSDINMINYTNQDISEIIKISKRVNFNYIDYINIFHIII